MLESLPEARVRRPSQHDLAGCPVRVAGWGLYVPAHTLVWILLGPGHGLPGNCPG